MREPVVKGLNTTQVVDGCSVYRDRVGLWMKLETSCTMQLEKSTLTAVSIALIQDALLRRKGQPETKRGPMTTQKDSKKPQVGIIMGSDTELPVMDEAALVLETFATP